MQRILLLAALLIAVGVLWRLIRPLGLAPDTVRRTLAAVVYHLLLPALVLSSLWRTPISADLFKVSVIAVTDVLLGLVLAWSWCRMCRMERKTAGALLLAAAFGNVSYLGLPVLESSLGPWSRVVAVQYDLFGCTPLLFTVGILVAQRYGGNAPGHSPLQPLLQSPPLWSALLALALNAAGVPLPAWLGEVLDRLAVGVAPLMLLVVGLSLQFTRDMPAQLPALLPVAAIQLVLMPLIIWAQTTLFGIGGGLQTALVLEAAMPSMILGIVLSERYGLDTGRYAQAVTVTTLFSMATLPMWFAVLQH